VPVVRLILLTDQQANLVRGVSIPGHELRPRRISAGPNAGKWTLPLEVLTDIAHEKHRSRIDRLPQADINTDVAWPEDQL
jgi:hypothetical protein